jgi:methylmalonyl-CoA mutase C-terminal domain/subunit
MTIFPKVLELMKENNINDKLLTGGGIIPVEDMEELQKIGVGKLFGPGSSTKEVIQYVKEWAENRH